MMAVIFLILIAAGVAGAYWLWAQRVEEDIRVGSDVAWERYERDEPEFIEGLTREKFNELYRTANFPRFPKYLLASIAAFVLALPFVFGVLSGAIWIGESIGVIPQPADLARYVPLGEGGTSAAQAEREERALYIARDFAGFYYYFGVVAAWLSIVAVFMRFYHKRRPGYLRDEIIRHRD